MLDISISIVLYHNDEAEVRRVINLYNQSPLKKIIYLIDNSTNDSLRTLAELENVEYVYLNNNVGYGSANNVAINKAKGFSKYHLISNADIDFDPDILKKGFEYMERNRGVGMISPQIHYTTGGLQYFCRKLPTPFDLFARRFIPGVLKPLFRTALDNYVLLYKDYSKPMNIPNLPGCFMFVRMKNLIEVDGFDENFFMYCEDIDLTRRLHEISKTLYYPQISIKHGLARGSYNFSKLVVYHIKSAIYYFNKWGWFVDNDRKKINEAIDKKAISSPMYVSSQVRGKLLPYRKP